MKFGTDSKSEINCDFTVDGDVNMDDLIINGKTITSNTVSQYLLDSSSYTYSHLTLDGFMYCKAILNVGETGANPTGTVFGGKHLC